MITELLKEEPKIFKSSYMLYVSENPKLSITQIAKSFKALSKKEKEELDDRLTKVNKEKSRLREKWLAEMTKQGYPNYPKYRKLKEFFGENFKATGAAKKLLAYAIGGFAQEIAKSLHSEIGKGELTIDKCVSFIEKDPDHLFNGIKEAKIFDVIMNKYMKKEMKD
jgi:hypothetical protein